MTFKWALFLGSIGMVLGKVQYMGMNIAGFEFGCQIDGTCPVSSAIPPLTTLGGGDGAGQMQHFVTDDEMNIFRFPVSWQFLVNNQLGGTLDPTNIGKYDQVIQACLSTGAKCAIDLHNFARFNGKIINQTPGGPTDAQFANIWTQLATKYQSNSNIIFGLMNEPHDLDVPTWANSCQAAVTAIRNAGATSQMILLPGTNFTSAGAFVSSGSGSALIGVKNPDGSNTNLILDVHKYLDIDNSGTHTDCTTDNIDAFQSVANFLRQNGRKALVSETGAASTSSCFTDFCAQNTFLNNNSDVFLGYIAWAAGSFSTSYTLSLTPSKKNGKYVDNALASQCVVSPWLNAAAVTSFPSVISTSAGGLTALTVLTGSATSMGMVASQTNVPTISAGTADSGMNATSGRVSSFGEPTSTPLLSSTGTSTAATTFLTTSGSSLKKAAKRLVGLSLLIGLIF